MIPDRRTARQGTHIDAFPAPAYRTVALTARAIRPVPIDPPNLLLMPDLDGPSDVDEDPGFEVGLPESLRLLCLSVAPPSWVGIALHLDGAGCHLPRFHTATSPGDALGLLRERSFDVVLIVEPNPVGLAESAIVALRTAGVEEPIVAVRTVPDDALVGLACRHEVDVLVTDRVWDSAAIVPTIARAVARRAADEEYRQLRAERHRRADRDRDEAERLLGQQQRIIADLAGPERDARSADRATLTAEVARLYGDLLRTHVIMGSGRLGDEVVRLAELLAEAGIGPQEALELHLDRVAALVRGLGNRSTRHVLARADLLALELVVHLGECFRARV